MTDVEEAWRDPPGSPGYSPSPGGAEVGPQAPLDWGGFAMEVDLKAGSDFWKDQPVGPGCILEMPVSGEHEGESAQAEVALFVTYTRAGCCVKPRMLGASAEWARQEGIQKFSRERQLVHLCAGGKDKCLDKEKKGSHVEAFTLGPPGPPCPEYIEAGKRREWKKLYREVMGEPPEDARGAGEALPFPSKEGDKVKGDRLSMLKEKLRSSQQRVGALRAPATGGGARPVPPDARVHFEPEPAALQDRTRREDSPRPKASPRGEGEEKEREGKRRRKTVGDALAAAAVAQGSRPGKARRKARDSRSSSSEKEKKGRKRRSRSRSRRRRKKRRRSDSRRSSSSGRDSTSSSLVPPLQRKAARNPGSVLKMLLQNVSQALAEAAVDDTDSQGRLGGKGNQMSSYFQIVARPQMTGKVRDLRELETISRCLDLLKAGKLAEVGDALAGRFHGSRICSADQQLERRPAPGGHSSAAWGAGATVPHVGGPTARPAGGESDRQVVLAPSKWMVGQCSSLPPGRGGQRPAERERRRPWERSRSRRKRQRSWRSMERQREDRGGRISSRQISPEALEAAYESALACWTAEAEPGDLGASASRAASSSDAPAAPGLIACDNCSAPAGGVALIPPCWSDPTAETFPSPRGAGSAKSGPCEEKGVFSWAAFECPAQLGLWLKGGNDAGNVPKGLSTLFEWVKHTASQDAQDRRPGVFPLPVVFESEVEAPHLVGASPEVQAWVNILCLALNRLSGWKKEAPLRRKGAQVGRILGSLRLRVEQFLGIFKPMFYDPQVLWEELKKKKLSYDGEEFTEPVEISVLQIEKSLPPLGHGGSVPLGPLLVGRSRFLLEHPEYVVRAPHLQEPGRNTARVHIKAGEELKVWKLLEERGIVGWINIKDVHQNEHGPFLSGLFGVPKPGRFAPSGDVLLRVIMNLKPINRNLDIIKGDIDELPMATTWAQLCLDEDEVIHISQADMSSAFYLFALPASWRRFMGFNARVNGGLIGRDAAETFVPTCKVLPMGWSSSVGLMQMASRELIRRSDCLGAVELRRQLQAPQWFVDVLLRDKAKQFWQVYLDNFMAAEVDKKGSTGEGSVRLHHQAVGVWTEAGVLCAEDKHVLAAQDGVELGVNLNGTAGLVGAGPERLHQLLAVTVVLLQLTTPKPKWVQIVLGRWIFALQFRRPLMSVLCRAWNYTKKGQDRRRWWPTVQRELALLVGLVPLIHADLKVTFNNVVTCSDASHFGGAVAASVALGSAGEHARRMARDPHLGPVETSLPVVSAFNGIGGAFRGYDLAGVRPVGLISIECDKGARRVSRKAWPHIEEINNILDVDKPMVEAWFNQYPRITHLHLVGGFPCVHLSSVRSGRMNLEGDGSKLFFNLVQLLEWCQEVFRDQAEVTFLIENVRSMDVSARAEISRILGVEPFGLCPSDILDYNRPRLAWTNGTVKPTTGVQLIPGSGITDVKMEGVAPPREGWLRPGWEPCCPATPFSTFMKAIPRQRPPPMPAGLSRCCAEAISRWKSDQFKFPPYQYKRENLLVDQEGNLRYLDSSERELLLGFGQDHTLFTWSAGMAKEDPEAWEDKRLSLCGDSFSMLSFGWLISQLCRNWVEPRSPQEIINRFGLPSGSSAAAQVEFPLISRNPEEVELVPQDHSGQLVAQLSRHVNHTGSDVSISMGTPFNSKGRGHASIRAHWWRWKLVFTSRWNFMNHINYLEMRVILQSIKWRARSAHSIGSRWLHLADSMVCNYVLSKGRTSSLMLQPLTREIAAHLLALNAVQLQGHVDSIENPTDAASRGD